MQPHEFARVDGAGSRVDLGLGEVAASDQFVVGDIDPGQADEPNPRRWGEWRDVVLERPHHIPQPGHLGTRLGEQIAEQGEVVGLPSVHCLRVAQHLDQVIGAEQGVGRAAQRSS
ncbi:hypothetical protein DVJ83_16825 (plasmid) [Deinococcus wulumuqiensis]|uniref:Uncharacterized protein n=1 Tax=Deinococcus wulumuqiensis TaxID=980427 RepID=A0A345IM72_9DEIO|nr:hypothetical protein DVJ83_16825 [Deinococcus wulumuqiensis]